MIILTLVKKDLKIAFKSPFSALFKFLIVPVIAYFIFREANKESGLNSPAKPEIFPNAVPFEIGIIGKEKYKDFAQKAGSTVSEYFPDRKAFNDFLGDDKRSRISVDFVQIEEKQDKREYSFILRKDYKPSKGEQLNWFSTTTAVRQQQSNDLGILAMKIEDQAASKKTPASISFLTGSQSSTFTFTEALDVIPNLIILFFVIAFFNLLPEFVKEREMKTLNLLYRQGITPFQIFSAKFIFGFLFFAPGLGVVYYFLVNGFLSTISGGLVLVLMGLVLVLTILTAYFLSLFFNSTKSSTSFSVVVFFGSVASTYGYKSGIIWWGFAYLLQLLPLVNNNTILNILFSLAVFQ